MPGLRLPPEQSLHAHAAFDRRGVSRPALPLPADAATPAAAPTSERRRRRTTPAAARPGRCRREDARRSPPVAAAACPSPRRRPRACSRTGSRRLPATGTILAGLGAASSLALYALLPEAHYIAPRLRPRYRRLPQPVPPPPR